MVNWLHKDILHPCMNTLKKFYSHWFKIICSHGTWKFWHMLNLTKKYTYLNTRVPPFLLLLLPHTYSIPIQLYIPYTVIVTVHMYQAFRSTHHWIRHPLGLPPCDVVLFTQTHAPTIALFTFLVRTGTSLILCVNLYKRGSPASDRQTAHSWSDRNPINQLYLSHQINR